MLWLGRPHLGPPLASLIVTACMVMRVPWQLMGRFKSGKRHASLFVRMSSAQRSFSFQMPHICLLWLSSGWYRVWGALSHAPSLPLDFSASCHRPAGSLAAWLHHLSTGVRLSASSAGSPEGGKAAARVVVCYMDSLSEPTEGFVPVKESSWGHCGRTPVTYETRGALWIMHKRDCFCHENVGFGPDVRMILLLLFF